MKNLFIIFLALAFANISFSQTTLQYKRVKIVENGVSKNCNDDIHFITFTNEGCYESDAKGFTENSSNFLTFSHSENGIKCYHGKGYYGNARYYFSTDLSRLNLYVNDNLIYVYQMQPGLVASGNMRKPKTSKNPNYSPGVTPPPPTYDPPQPYKPSEDYYREMYARWERVVESAYRSLTSLGLDVRYKDGKREGYSDSSWQGSNYSGMLNEFHKAQRELRNTRMEASRHGYRIHVSSWETATVH